MTVLEMEGIVKEFPGVKALDNVSFSVQRGEIHALCGENGAGKSTLMKVLSGLYAHGSYEGKIMMEHGEQMFKTIKDAEHAGIAIIYQELALVKHMTVAENLILGNEPARFGVINRHEMYRETEKWLSRVGLKGVSPETITGTLGIGQQQLIEIAKALSKNAKILILDEPTAALTEQEVDILLSILKEFRNQGVTCIYISHKLNEVFDIADHITILRDGKTIGTYKTSAITEDQVIAYMVGREMTNRYPDIQFNPKEVVLSLKDYSVYHPDFHHKKVINNVSLEVRKGEILGIAGLMGSGRTELAMSLFGAYGGKTEGDVYIEGEYARIKTTQGAIRKGIALVSEDRKKYGLVLNMDIKKNVTLPSLKAITSFGSINQNEEVRYGTDYLRKLRIKAKSVETVVGTLSGGNQQKVVIGKWLMTNPKVLILDEPTRGIDIGAKLEIYQIMHELLNEGVAIIMISSELPEILGMSHRVAVLCEGRLAATLPIKEATQENIMKAATGGV
ncbi:xylose ABC transporter ATP-binding protein [Priestia koreensis]|uniref:xylose ABC transporter ATP-binding protein n=1 Tax=Priestia koreensis TaxID=284581 RepID=UPI001F5618C4|nr:xylose ABC transporter ATP-binding protein [Priestia koreensis]MCM3006456.1 xylose ABC transporter ATP-binding protein [Priestia koreensis]UNL83642.1 xylose ABC transporter ATP-binding protein [Priestia koreensis]